MIRDEASAPNLALGEEDPVGDGGLARAESHPGGVPGPGEPEVLDERANRIGREELPGPELHLPRHHGGEPHRAPAAG